MTGGAIQWMGLIIEVAGLLLVAIELYLPALSERVKVFFERIQFRFIRRPGTRHDWKWVAIGSYIFVWVVSATIVSIWEPSMNIVANFAFTIFTIFLGVLISASRMFVRLGIVLGRGNVIGGVGLVLACIGFTIELSQLVMA